MKPRAWQGKKGVLVLTLISLVFAVLRGTLWPVTTSAQDAETIVYKPPRRGAPGGREGGGSRGPGSPLPTLVVLAPRDHTGLTVQAQPVLYWYLSHEAPHPAEISLTDRQSIKPLLENHLDPPVQPGLHIVRLAEHGLHLTPGVTYTWSVALIINPRARSQDLVTTGTIEHTPPSDALRSQVAQAQATPLTLAHLYAASGLWYDTIAVLSDLIQAAPQQTLLRQQRAALLTQEGLQEVAVYDRQDP